MEIQVVLRGFLDEEGRLKSFPAKRKKQLYALLYLATKFEPNKVYNEKLVNEIINDNTTFTDAATLRRDLCDMGFLGRKEDCSEYWLEDNQPTADTLGIE